MDPHAEPTLQVVNKARAPYWLRRGGEGEGTPWPGASSTFRGRRWACHYGASHPIAFWGSGPLSFQRRRALIAVANHMAASDQVCVITTLSYCNYSFCYSRTLLIAQDPLCSFQAVILHRTLDRFFRGGTR
jgi:hypothetical protein